jgi:hypothetical protein
VKNTPSFALGCHNQLSSHGLSVKWITGECAVTRSDDWAQDHAGLDEDFLKFGSGELSRGSGHLIAAIPIINTTNTKGVKVGI